MRVENQTGVVAIISFSAKGTVTHFGEQAQSLLTQATATSFITPSKRLDSYDESILTFDDALQALFYLTDVVTATIALKHREHIDIDLRLGMCRGDYFVHGDQIYGEAVNLATKLTYSSTAENEMILCGIDHKIVRDFVRSHSETLEIVNGSADHCIFIRLQDSDETQLNASEPTLKIEHGSSVLTFKASLKQKIRVGRVDNCDIVIDDFNVSRNHATLRVENGYLVIEDHSSNGTYIYSDAEEIFVLADSAQVSGSGRISFGKHEPLADLSSPNVIRFQLL